MHACSARQAAAAPKPAVRCSVLSRCVTACAGLLLWLRPDSCGSVCVMLLLLCVSCVAVHPDDFCSCQGAAAAAGGAASRVI